MFSPIFVVLMLRRCLVFGGLVLFVLLEAACSGPAKISQQTLSEPPSIDGSLNDWGGALTYVNDRPISVGAFPTDSLLYVAVSIQDRKLIQSVAANGLIVWVDPTNEQKRSYGIQYPLGLRRQGVGQTGTGEEEPPSTQQTSLLSQVSLSELEVVRGDSARRRIPARFSSGLRADAELGAGSLIYEVAIPIRDEDGSVGGQNRRHGMRTGFSETVSLGLETPQPDEDADLLDQREGTPTMTGGRNRRGRRGSPRRRLPEAQRSDQPSLDLWVTIVPGDSR